VSFTASLYQTSANVPVMPVIRGIIGLSALIGLTMFFKPLLTGIARALMLIVCPPLSKQKRVARRQLRDARLMQRMINSSQGPSHASELRAMMARG
jgi:hypothetical protein